MAKNRFYRIELWFIFILAGVMLLTMVNSGTLTPFGLSFWGPHGHDAIFHLSLIENFAKNPWPLNNPLLSGTLLTNYHLLFDYLTGWLVRLTNIPGVDWYFRLWPVALSLALGLLVSRLLKDWGYGLGSRLVALLLVFWGGSLGHLPNLLISGNLWGGESRFWATQAVSILINPPLALSLVFLTLWLIWLRQFLRQPKLVWGIALTILVGVMFQTKAYSAVLVTGALVLTTVWEIIAAKFKTNKKQLPLLGLTLATICITGINYWLTASQGESLFIFAPFYLLNSMLASPDRLNLPGAARAWDNYFAGGQLIKLSLLQLVAIGLFIFGNFGVRLAALVNRHPLDFSRRFVWSAIILGFAVPLFFIQRGTSWNTIQFMYYSLFFTSLLAAPVWARLLRRARRLPELALALGVFLFLALPASYGTLRDYLSPTPASSIPYDELRGLELITSGPVLTPLFVPAAGRNFAQPLPLSVYENTAYVSAVTGTPTILADEVNLTIMAYDFGEKKRDVSRFYLTGDREFMSEFLAQQKVAWIYQTDFVVPRVDPASLGYRLLFDSGRTLVYTRNQ